MTERWGDWRERGKRRLSERDRSDGRENRKGISDRGWKEVRKKTDILRKDGRGKGEKTFATPSGEL